MDFTKDPSIRKAIMIIYYFAFHYGQKRKKKPQAKPKRNETSKVLTEQWKIVKNELRGSGAVQVKKKPTIEAMVNRFVTQFILISNYILVTKEAEKNNTNRSEWMWL